MEMEGDLSLQQFLSGEFVFPRLTLEQRQQYISWFANLPDSLSGTRVDKFQFNSIGEVPVCKKYLTPKHVNYIQADRVFCGWKMQPIRLNIKQVIDKDESHFLVLHSVRYDKVKCALSNGEIDMPMIYVDEDNIPSVQDGRHRLVASLKFGFSYIDVNVPIEQVDIINAYYQSF